MLFTGGGKVEKLKKQTQMMIQKQAIDAARVITLSTDWWTKKGLTESYMAISCANYDQNRK